MTLQHNNVKYEPVLDGRLEDSFEDDSRTAYDETSSSLPFSSKSSHSCGESIRRPLLVAIFVFAVMAAAFVAGIGGYYYGRAAESDEHTLNWFCKSSNTKALPGRGCEKEPHLTYLHHPQHRPAPLTTLSTIARASRCRLARSHRNTGT